MFVLVFVIGFILGIIFYNYAVSVVSVHYPEEFDAQIIKLRAKGKYKWNNK